jgi:hypothetical protein
MEISLAGEATQQAEKHIASLILRERVGKANGSRERAPDDRLREAIHFWTPQMDCFVARAPRNDDVK